MRRDFVAETVNDDLRAEITRLTQRLAAAEEWREAILGLVETWPEFESLPWAGDKRGWGFVFEMLKAIKQRLAAAESERAASEAERAEAEAERDELFIAARRLIKQRERNDTQGCSWTCKAMLALFEAARAAGGG